MRVGASQGGPPTVKAIHVLRKRIRVQNRHDNDVKFIKQLLACVGLPQILHDVEQRHRPNDFNAMNQGGQKNHGGPRGAQIVAVDWATFDGVPSDLFLPVEMVCKRTPPVFKTVCRWVITRKSLAENHFLQFSDKSMSPLLHF